MKGGSLAEKKETACFFCERVETTCIFLCLFVLFVFVFVFLDAMK